jgi:putative membrane protein
MRTTLQRFAVLSALTLITAGAALAQQDNDSGTLKKVIPAPVEARSPIQPIAPQKHLTFQQDQMFVKEALQRNLMETAVGKLATQQGSRPEVRWLGRKLVDDRSRMDDLMSQAAFQLSVRPPETMGKKDSSVLAMLGELSGSQFDDAFLRWVMRSHKRSLVDFQLEAYASNTVAAQKMAAQGAEMIREHLQMIEHIVQNSATSAKLGE